MLISFCVMVCGVLPTNKSLRFKMAWWFYQVVLFLVEQLLGSDLSANICSLLLSILYRLCNPFTMLSSSGWRLKIKIRFVALSAEKWPCKVWCIQAWWSFGVVLLWTPDHEGTNCFLGVRLVLCQAWNWALYCKLHYRKWRNVQYLAWGLLFLSLEITSRRSSAHACLCCWSVCAMKLQDSQLLRSELQFTEVCTICLTVACWSMSANPVECLVCY